MPRMLSRRRFNRYSAALSLALALPNRANATVGRPRPLPFLRGVNFTGLTHEPGSQAPSPHAVDYYLVKKRMNVVRLNFTWEFIQPELDKGLDPANVGIIDDQVDRITATGSYVILELHNYGRRTVRNEEHIIGESPFVTSRHLAEVWRLIALRWGKNLYVIFALMNEPHDQSTKTLVAVSNAAIAAIRGTGCGNMIMVSGNAWNSLGWFKSDNQALLLEIEDPINHFCFDIHHYFDEWSRGLTPNVRADPLSSMKEFTRWAKAHRQRAFCGEFGCGVNRRGLDACRALLEHIEANRAVYVGWAWLGAGGPWQPDYVFLLDPFASVTSRTNPDPQGSASWENPVDRPQMKLLQAFLPEGATPFNGWLIEDQLRPVLKALLRHGDYQPPETRWLAGRWKDTSLGWLDSGPHDLNAVASNDPPSLLPDGGVHFSSAGQFLLSDLSSNGESESIYAMVQVGSPASAERRSIVGSAGLSLSTGRRYWVMPGNRIDLVHSDSAPDNTMRPTIPPNTKILVQAAYSADRSAPYMQKTVLGVATRVFTFLSAGPTGSARGRTVFGAADASGSKGLDGVLFDVAVFSVPLSDADDAKVQGRLYWDNGLAHLLPDTHPYRRRPPSIY